MAEFVEKMEWNGLQEGLQAHVVEYLTCRERAKLSSASKSFRKACATASLHFPGIKTGTLPAEVPESRPEPCQPRLADLSVTLSTACALAFTS
jgi:hypothetical protein